MSINRLRSQRLEIFKTLVKVLNVRSLDDFSLIFAAFFRRPAAIVQNVCWSCQVLNDTQVDEILEQVKCGARVKHVRVSHREFMTGSRSDATGNPLSDLLDRLQQLEQGPEEALSETASTVAEEVPAGTATGGPAGKVGAARSRLAGQVCKVHPAPPPPSGSKFGSRNNGRSRSGCCHWRRQ